jgi:UDP-N-acetylmuramate--alanine ligase
VRGWELSAVDLELAVPGEHNRRNAAAALAALELAGVARADAERAIGGFTGVGRRFELVGERGGVRVIDDYAHNPTEIAATLRTARDVTERRLIAVYQPHVYERTRQLHRELGAALGADAAIVTDVIDGADAPIEGVGQARPSTVPPPTRRGWAPTPEDAATIAPAWARPGDAVVTSRGGKPWRIARPSSKDFPHERDRGRRPARKADDHRNGWACARVRALADRAGARVRVAVRR